MLLEIQSVITEIIQNKAYCYQGNQTKRCIMLIGNSNQVVPSVVKEIKLNDICYHTNQTKQCAMLSGISYQMIHNLIMEIKPNDA